MWDWECLRRNRSDGGFKACYMGQEACGDCESPICLGLMWGLGQCYKKKTCMGDLNGSTTLVLEL